MIPKRPYAEEDSIGRDSRHPSKRPRGQLSGQLLTVADPSSSDGKDRLSRLSDELILRVLSFLSLPHLLCTAPVSHRLCCLSSDPSLWRALYYSRFILPRALRIPGFREGAAREGRIHCSSRLEGPSSPSPCWKRQYRLRHNWARGKCAVEELLVTNSPQDGMDGGKRVLVKVVDGFAVTADLTFGMRAWDLKTKSMVAHTGLRDGQGQQQRIPSSLAIDDRAPSSKTLDIAVGFNDGTFGVWRLDTGDHTFIRRYKHEDNVGDGGGGGELVAIAISYPFVFAANKTARISLYTFDVAKPAAADGDNRKGVENRSSNEANTSSNEGDTTVGISVNPPEKPSLLLHPPQIITSLKSHTSRSPLTLSIRRAASKVIASVAYAFYPLRGWSLGIQDLILDISPNSCSASHSSSPTITTTRVAYTDPIVTGRHSVSCQTTQDDQDVLSTTPASSHSLEETTTPYGPTTLCYSHPYLLATLPDNTLILHLCTSTSSSLSIGPGIRLWGHTSGISDAEITARGKAVSVSRHGDEIRVWELEGRAGGKSVEVRPNMKSEEASLDTMEDVGVYCGRGGGGDYDGGWEVRRNWVGFDDEMVIVLKEARGGGESLAVYDFT